MTCFQKSSTLLAAVFISICLDVLLAAPSYTVSIVAGVVGKSGFNGDGIPATQAFLTSPWNVFVDFDGSLLISESRRVRRVYPNGTIATMAGTGTTCNTGDGLPATSTGICPSSGDIVRDRQGNLLIVQQSSSCVRRISAATGLASNFAGICGSNGHTGNGNQAIYSRLYYPSGISLNPVTGDIRIADTYNHRIKSVSAVGEITTTLAGTGVAGYFGQGGQPADYAQLNYPNDIAHMADATLIVADKNNCRVRRITGSGIWPLAGTGPDAYGTCYHAGGDGPTGTAATSAGLLNPMSVAVHQATGRIFIADYAAHRIKMIDPTDWRLYTIAGNGSSGLAATSPNIAIGGDYRSWIEGDGGPATAGVMRYPTGVAVDADGNVYVASPDTSVIRKLTPVVDPSTSSTKSGTATGSPTATTSPSLTGSASATLSQGASPSQSATPTASPSSTGTGTPSPSATGSNTATATGTPTPTASNRVPQYTVSTIAGVLGKRGFNGDGLPATQAWLSSPWTLFVDVDGSLLVGESSRVRRITRNGMAETMAGNGSTCNNGDGLPASSAGICPSTGGIARDQQGNLLVVESGYSCVRRINASTGLASRFAGMCGSNGHTGDGNQAIFSRLYYPSGISLNPLTGDVRIAGRY